MSDSPGHIFTSLLQPPPIPTVANNPLELENANSQPPSSSTIPEAAIAVSSITPAQSSVQEPSKQLDVTDALSYLDLVKVQFENLPAIYNK